MGLSDAMWVELKKVGFWKLVGSLTASVGTIVGFTWMVAAFTFAQQTASRDQFVALQRQIATVQIDMIAQGRKLDRLLCREEGRTPEECERIIGAIRYND